MSCFYYLLKYQDNVTDFIKVGGLQKLQEGEFIVQVCFPFWYIELLTVLFSLQFGMSYYD